MRVSAAITSGLGVRSVEKVLVSVCSEDSNSVRSKDKDTHS